MMADPIQSMSKEDFVQYVIQCMNRAESRLYYKLMHLPVKDALIKCGIVKRLDLNRYLHKLELRRT